MTYHRPLEVLKIAIAQFLVLRFCTRAYGSTSCVTKCTPGIVSLSYADAMHA